MRSSNDFRLLCGRVVLSLAGVLLLRPVPGYTFNSPQQQPVSACTQPDDVDLAFTFCDAAHDDIANEYGYPLYDVATGMVIPPIILKAIGGAETQWLQCQGGVPVTNGCDWGLMQIGSGMNCVDPAYQFNYDTQQQVKYDYRYNVGMGAKILKWKWDARVAESAIIGDGSPGIAEHWYYAVWSYGTSGWSWDSCPSNPAFSGCNWPNPADVDDCAYVDQVWWWARNPWNRNGRLLWHAVDLTRPSLALFPAHSWQWNSWSWAIDDPLPVHRSVCRVSLPLVLKDYPPCEELIQDGGFEDLNWNYWTRIGDPTHSPLRYSGSLSAWLGGYNDADDTLYQTIDVPDLGPEGDPVVSVWLSYYWYMDTDEDAIGQEYDHFYTRIRDTDGGTLRDLEHLTNLSTENTWALSAFDITEFKGQTVQVYLNATTDYTLHTSFYVDDVSTYACEAE